MFGRIRIATTLALTALPLMAVGRTASAATVSRAPAAPPGIRIWTAHGDTYRRGERVQVYFRTENDAYVTIFRVDTDGRVRILFPRDPYDPNLAHGGETYTVQDLDDRDAFMVDDYPGVGYVFAVASQDPFIYDAFTASDHWSLEQIGGLAEGRIHGDPYSSLQDLAQHIMPDGYADYDTHLLPYYVEQRYQYPRFLCYDCHAYIPYAYWDPYSHFCSRFSLFVYYDPFYFYPSYWYPTRYYRGTNVVYVRPRFGGSQYVFRGVDRGSAAGVVYRDRRNGGVQAPGDRGVRGADLGGVGSVPAPGGGGRRVAPVGIGQAQGAAPGQAQPGMIGGSGGAQPGRRAVSPSEALPQTPTRSPQVKQFIVDEASGRRQPVSTPPPLSGSPGRAIAPDKGTPREISPEAQPPRGVYIDAGTRAEPRVAPSDPRSQPAAAGGRYIPQPRTQPESRGYAQPESRGNAQPESRGYARPESRGNAPPPSRPQAQGGGGRSYAPPPQAPRATPRSEPRSAPSAAPRGQSGPAPRAQAPTLIRRRP